MRKMIGLALCMCLIFAGCQQPDHTVSWGSFTPEKTYSYDLKYYAEQEVIEIDGLRFVEVTVYNQNCEPVYSFVPARAFDFWGICWENDSYNIWAQSADVGVSCYRFDDETWTEDNTATRPDYIISKYDQN